MINVFKTLGILLFFISASSFANCLSQSADVKLINHSISEGSYRFLAKSDVAKVVDLSDLNFEDYLVQTEQQITALNPRANVPCPVNNYVLNQQNISAPTITDLVKPYQLTHANSDKVVLLIHGLTDSPYSFHDLSAFYHQQGFNVRTVLLPGHGTAAEHLRYVDYNDWRALSAFAIEQSLNDFEQVYLGGFSTGAGLILDYMLTRKSLSPKLSGVMLFAPATKAKNSMSWLAQYIDYVPFLNWLDKDADVDFAKYESFPINAGAQVHHLMSDVYPLTKHHITHNVPMFVAVPEHDMTIDTAATLDLLAQWQRKTPTPLTLVYYGERDNANQLSAFENVKLVTPQCMPKCDDQLQMAHTAIPNAPSNIHYGEHAVYRNCGHYLADVKKYNACKVTPNIPASEKTPLAGEKHALFQRLSYKPYYSELTNELALFLAK